MAKWINITAIFLLLAPVFLRSQNQRTVRVGVYQNRPKIFTDSKGIPQGLFIDIVEEIAKAESWKIEYTVGEWVDLKKGLSEGKIDILPDMAYSVERDSLFSLNKIPVIESWLEVFVSYSDSMSSILELSNKKIGVLVGSIQEGYLKKEIKNQFKIEYTVVDFPSYTESIEALKDGKIDAVIADRFFYYSDLFDKDVKATNIVFRPTQIYFAFAKKKKPGFDVKGGQKLNQND